MRALFLLTALFALVAPLRAEETSTLVEKPLAQLTDRAITPLGERALAIRPTEWKHGETANFAFHYFSDATAKPMALEAEFYYRVISKELERDTTKWERKCHVFVFEDDADWAKFKTAGGLEPWSGGIHAQGELFLQRDPHQKFKGNALAHELTHLIVFRFFGPGVPLWLNEGLAEYTATRWYASFWRARGFGAFPKSMSVDPANYLPLGKLTSALSYPQKDAEVIAFYAESERLVRFLSASDKHKFSLFLEAMSKGARFDSALDKNFGTAFFNLDALEKQFQPYAQKDHVDTP
ncbi:MAG TPA: hypothetical protein VGO11_18125 [Chthoniobacteraceae bacterium]|jgi:hypothetical protein|nr:hypothetical protein [Chthoniobacteraceae bacterium]